MKPEYSILLVILAICFGSAVKAQECNNTVTCESFSTCCQGKCVTNNGYTIPLGESCNPYSACEKCAGMGACIGEKCLLSTIGCPCDTSNEPCATGYCTAVKKNSNICGPYGAANGGPCFVDKNCASQNCIKGTCQGIGYIDEPCEYNSDCLSNLCVAQPGKPKKCIAPLPAGAICGPVSSQNSQSPCAAGLACSYEASDVTYSKQICIPKYSKPAGSLCVFNEYSAVDESCAGSVCGHYYELIEPGSYKPITVCDAAGVHKEGEFCDQVNNVMPTCEAGLICNRGATNFDRPVCTKPYSVQEGGGCGSDVVCADGLRCLYNQSTGQYGCVNTVGQVCNASQICGNRAKCVDGVCALDQNTPPPTAPTCVQELIDMLQSQCWSDYVLMSRGVEFNFSTPECGVLVLKYKCCKDYCYNSIATSLRHPFVVDCSLFKISSWSPEPCCGATSATECQRRVLGCGLPEAPSTAGAPTTETVPSTEGVPSADVTGGDVNDSQLVLLIVFGVVGILAIGALIFVIVRDKRNKLL